jgi:hypothetical protein
MMILESDEKPIAKRLEVFYEDDIEEEYEEDDSIHKDYQAISSNLTESLIPQSFSDVLS